MRDAIAVPLIIGALVALWYFEPFKLHRYQVAMPVGAAAIVWRLHTRTGALEICDVTNYETWVLTGEPIIARCSLMPDPIE